MPKPVTSCASIPATDGWLAPTALLTTARISVDGNADIDLTTLGKGLYIVKTPKTSIKILNQ